MTRTPEKAKSTGYTYKGEKPPKVVRGVQRTRKDTKRWCRGKVGVEHKPQIHTPTRWGKVPECSQPELCPRWFCYEEEFCTTCGKILRYGLGEDCSSLRGKA